MTEIIAVTNQKGGVAKTTNTINIAGALADEGYDVLAVDGDPQGYLTHRLGFKDAYGEDGDTFYEAYLSPSDFDVSDLVVEHDEIDVLPANVDMFQLEQELTASGMQPRKRLDSLFRDVSEWDAIIVDAPPSLGPLNDNVVLASDSLLIPAAADNSARLALTHLFRQLDTLEDHYDTTVDVQGVLVSNVEYPLDNEQEDALSWFEDRFETQAPVWVVRNRVAIARAIDQHHGSLYHPDAEDCDMKQVFTDVAREVMA